MKDSQKQRPSDDLDAAAAAIREGRLVVFPTETVYGLGADALNAEAVASIFAAKGRPADNPLIVHVAGVEQATPLVRELPDVARKLFEEFSPGPLTLVLPASERVPRVVTAGLATVAIRVPAHDLARELLLACRRPIAAPSANRSGEPSPTTVEMARRSLGERVSVYLDGGPCRVGLESTVISVDTGGVVMLRPGAIAVDDVRRVLPGVAVEIASGGGDRPASPGMKHRHYQPRARVVAVTEDVSVENLRAALAACGAHGRGDERTKCMLMGMEGPVTGVAGALTRLGEFAVASVHAPGSLERYARGLYAWFHEADEARMDAIVAVLPPADGMGTAIRDRLVRSSSIVLDESGRERLS
ncbi:MAG: L-threonylcarbamoyladenylate synthase [Spirochaetota bacterium]